MREALALSTHKPVPWTTVVTEEFRIILRRHRWELLFLTILLFLVDWDYEFFIYRAIRGDGGTFILRRSLLWTDFMYWSLFKAALAAFWGIWIWRDENRDNRSTFWTMPVARSSHQLIRIVTGALFLLIMYLVGWYAGIGLTATIGPIDGLIAGFLPPIEYPALLLSYLNIYLLASVIALVAENAQRGVFFFLPAGFLIIFGLSLLIDSPPVHLVFGVFLPPYGILGGLGFGVWDSMGSSVDPAVWAPVMWFGILLATVVFTASRHQER